MSRALLIAGTESGVGKTTVTAAVIAGLARRGKRVQPFKTGPDYIDPTFHSLAAGRTCRNLDSWLVPVEPLSELYSRAAASADIAVIEGVMGLFDGRSFKEPSGSTASLAKLLGCPVILVVDIARTAQSAAATVLGFRQMDPNLNVAGVILNNAANAGHAEMAIEAIAATSGAPILGSFPRRPEIARRERHLGLVPAGESRFSVDDVQRLAQLAEEHLDLDRIWQLAQPVLVDAPASPKDGQRGLFPSQPLSARTRIAVAMDEAFGFYYQDNLDLLTAWGAELAPFSPLSDEHLPSGAGALYIGGGFPEVFAQQLSCNRQLQEEIRAFAGPIYAECGGLMYLTEGIRATDGLEHPMVGLIEGWSELPSERVVIGYRECTAARSTFLLPADGTVRGHEFHWSRLSRAFNDEEAAYVVHGRDGDAPEGVARPNLLASYIHLHFGSNPTLAPRFVEAAARFIDSGSPSAAAYTHGDGLTSSGKDGAVR